jgi:histone-arginine methyltransferase CARM1
MGRKRPRSDAPPKWSEPLLSSETRDGDANDVGTRGTNDEILEAKKPTSSARDRYHLSVVRELNVGSGSRETKGASVDHTRVPAWIHFQPDGRVVIAVAGGCQVVAWDAKRETRDVAALDDAALVVSVAPSRSDDASNIARDAPSEASGLRAFVLGFHEAIDAETVRALLSLAREKKAPAAAEAARLDDVRRREEDHLGFAREMDEASCEKYFAYYASLAEQQNMLQDDIRTGTYFTALLENAESFKNKIVLDVGAGSGILSCFACFAGARRVYAVEASEMALHCERVVRSDPRLRSVIRVIKGRVESREVREAIETDLRELLGRGRTTKVDVLISEPMGTMLFNERMIESYLLARDAYLKPKTEGGLMFPCFGRLHCAVYEDDVLSREISEKAHFWTREESKDFYGIDLTVLGDDAVKTYFSQPVVDAFDPGILLTDPTTFEFDFSDVDALRVADLESIAMTSRGAEKKPKRDGVAHGLAWWFDVAFPSPPVRVRGERHENQKKKKKKNPRWLTTAPGTPTTHWFQMRLPLRAPLRVSEKNDRIDFETHMLALSNRSYRVLGSISLSSSGGERKDESGGAWNLKDPYYRQLVWPQPGYAEAHAKRRRGDEKAALEQNGGRFSQ